jgi:hypothetical protein
MFRRVDFIYKKMEQKRSRYVAILAEAERYCHENAQYGPYSVRQEDCIANVLRAMALHTKGYYFRNTDENGSLSKGKWVDGKWVAGRR